MEQHLDTLKTYIDSQRASGVRDELIYQTLRSSGWQHEMVTQALAVQPDEPVVEPLVTPQPVVMATATAMPVVAAAEPIQKGLSHGRLGRTGFLMAHLYILAYFILAIALVVLGQRSTIVNIIGFLLGGLGVLVAMVLPFFFYARRWHDINQSGWLALLLLIPGAVLPIMIILLCVPGTPEANQYGHPGKKSLSPAVVYGIR